MLLAEELALVALRPDTGRFLFERTHDLNACMAALLVGERMVVGAGAPSSPALAAAAEVVAEKGPRLRPVLSHMSRGLAQRIGTSTRETVLDGLAGAGIVGPATGGFRPRRPLVDPAARQAVLGRLRAAAAGDEPIDPRTALVLNMTGPARLLEVVAPERRSRRHARSRIDHALDATPMAPLGEAVRRLIKERNAAAAGVA